MCTRVGGSLQLIDPSTLQLADVPSTVYWRTPFDTIAQSSDLVEFIVLDIEPSGPTNGKYILADAQVTLNSALHGGTSKAGGMDVDTGRTDEVFHTRTHLGRILNPGDTVFGYFLGRSNINNDDYDALPKDQLPDVVLIKKSYPNRRKKHKNRNWKLKSIAKEAEEGPDAFGRGALGRRGGVDQDKVERDYENFLRDLEEDPELRATVNLYKSDVTMAEPSKKQGGKRRGAKAGDAMEVESEEGAAMADTEATDEDDEVTGEDDFPQINPDELLDALDDLTLQDKDEPPV